MMLIRFVLNDLSLSITDGEHASVLDDIKGEYFLLSNKNIKDNKILFDDSDRKINFESFKKINKRTNLGYNDVIISTVGTIGKTAIIKDTNLCYDFQRSVGIIKTNKNKLIPEFLHYYFQLPFVQKRLINLSSGAVQKCLFISDLKRIEIDIPEKFQIQKSIAKVLSDLDSKIELNNKINQELEAMAKTLYDYWFVQFDFPNEHGKPYKSSGGKMVYNEELKREVPEDWEVKTISEWIQKEKNGDWGKESKEGNYNLKVSCVRGADLNGLNGNGKLNSPTRFILEKNSNKLLENYDLIVEISGGSPTQSTGRLGFITEETLKRFPNPLICSNFCKALTLKDKKYLYNFVYQWNRLYDYGVLFGWEGKTSGIKNLLFDSFVSNQKEIYPKSDIVKKFYDFVKPIHAKKQKNLIENQRLIELRDWLLPMLMNGQVTVKEAKEKLNSFDELSQSMAAEPIGEYKIKSKE